VLRCVCADGTETGQKQERHAAFFVTHGLTLFAVESILVYRSGFFGLIAAGGDIEGTTGKSRRFSDRQLAEVRARRAELLTQRAAVAIGGTLAPGFD